MVQQGREGAGGEGGRARNVVREVRAKGREREGKKELERDGG